MAHTLLTSELALSRILLKIEGVFNSIFVDIGSLTVGVLLQEPAEPAVRRWSSFRLPFFERESLQNRELLFIDLKRFGKRVNTVRCQTNTEWSSDGEQSI